MILGLFSQIGGAPLLKEEQRMVLKVPLCCTSSMLWEEFSQNPERRVGIECKPLHYSNVSSWLYQK